MSNSNMEHAALAVRRQRQRHQRNALLALLGCVVVLITASSLMMPAISMTRGELVCGLEEHEHSSACYERVLVCGETETADASASALATQSDEEGNEADEADEAEKADKAPEASKADGAGKASETDGADEAPETEKAPADDAAEPEKADQAKPAGHVHTEACYETRLVCGMEEHVHSDGCYASGQEQGEGSAASSDMPAQRFEQKVDDRDDFRVVVEAPEGAFPAETSMDVEAVAADDIKSTVEDAVAAKTDVPVSDIQAVDITFTDSSGDEIEPSKEIVVRIANDLIADNAETMLVHIADDGQADVVDTLTAQQLTARNLDANEDEIIFESSNFSIYVLAAAKKPDKDYAATDGTLDNGNMTVRVQGNLNKLNDYQVVVENALGNYADAAAAYHIYLKDSNGDEVSNYDGKSSFKVTITYASKQDWFSQVKESKHYGTNDHKDKGFLDNPKFAQDGKSISFKVSSFSDFVFVKNPSSSGGSAGDSGNASTSGEPYLISKTAEATGTENEFEVTLNVNPSITWPKKTTVHYQGLDEIFEASGVWLINSNNKVNKGVYNKDSSITDATNYTQIKNAAGISGQANGGRIMTPTNAAKATSSNPNKEFKITKITIDSTTISLSKPYYVWLTTNSNITCLWVLPNGNYLKLSASVDGRGDCTLTFKSSLALCWPKSVRLAV